MSELYQSLSHSKWDCKYHIVFVPKRRRKVIFGQTRRHRGTDFPFAGSAKGVPDYRRASDAGPCAYVHRHSPKAPGGIGARVSEREECYRQRSPERQGTQLYWEHFWARGYAVSTVGFELEQVRQYIRQQETADGAAGQF